MLTFKFIDVDLNELRSERIKFSVEYKSVPRVYRLMKGTFESNDFKNSYISRRDDLIKYEWKINLNSDQFIEFNIDSLNNEANIHELTINDDSQNLALYDKNEIATLPIRTKSFLIATSQLTVRFTHIKNLPRDSRRNALAFLKCSYVARPRVIHVEQLGGVLEISNKIVKNKLNWLLIAPKDYFIVIKIKEFVGKGQLKFSLLNTDYNPRGKCKQNFNKKFFLIFTSP